MRKSLSGSDRFFEIAITSSACLLLASTGLPLLFIISASFSNPEQLVLGHVWLWPVDFTLESYRKVLLNKEVWTGLRNSLYYTVTGSLLNIGLTILAAYPLSRRGLGGRKAITLFITFTMIFQGGMVPTYLLVQHLGLLDSVWAMILPGAISVFNFFVARTYFQSNVPEELVEAAIIDGASHYRILWSVVLPLSTPIVAVLAIYYSVHHWNTFVHALLFLSDRGKFPLQIFLRTLLISNAVSDFSDPTESVSDRVLAVEGLRYALIIVGSAPVLLLYPLLQRFLAKNLTLGAIKG